MRTIQGREKEAEGGRKNPSRPNQNPIVQEDRAKDFGKMFWEDKGQSDYHERMGAKGKKENMSSLKNSSRMWATRTQ